MTNLSPFDVQPARDINRARLDHLGSLGLDLNRKRVIDVGGGPGHLAQFFVQRGCRVTSVDGRAENIETLRSTYSGLESHVLDVENERLDRLGGFEVVFCYGLLYHTELAAWVLDNIAHACDGLIALETCIMDDSIWACEIVQDSPAINQGLRGIGCRPTPRFVVEQLRSNSLHTYLPTRRPQHPDFSFQYRADHAHLRDGVLMRQVFIASRRALSNPLLVPTVDASELFGSLYR